MNLVMVFCAYMTFLYMPFDMLLKPVAEDQEVWFGYMLTVGAYEEVAQGCWRRDGKSVVLEPSKIRANDGEPSFAKRLKLAIDTKGGLVRSHKGRRYGVYVRGN